MNENKKPVVLTSFLQKVKLETSDKKIAFLPCSKKDMILLEIKGLYKYKEMPLIEGAAKRVAEIIKLILEKEEQSRSTLYVVRLTKLKDAFLKVHNKIKPREDDHKNWVIYEQIENEGFSHFLDFLKKDIDATRLVTEETTLKTLNDLSYKSLFNFFWFHHEEKAFGNIPVKIKKQKKKKIPKVVISLEKTKDLKSDDPLIQST